jgi:hypothetical protein
MTKRRALLLVETVGSITWFAMDACWMLNAAVIALLLAAPTVVLNLLVLRFSPRKVATLLVAGAMAAWACMNVLWMTGDMKLFDHGLIAGKAFLLLGALMIGLALIINRADALRDVLGRFRRLRLRA